LKFLKSNKGKRKKKKKKKKRKGFKRRSILDPSLFPLSPSFSLYLGLNLRQRSLISALVIFTNGISGF
jgi:hypothetical protein